MTWLPIESAPRDGTPVIVAAKNRAQTIVGEARFDPEDGDGNWWWAGENWGDAHAESMAARGWHPTHWQPLPPPPSEGDAALRDSTG